jgi:hypothetical protein
MLAKMNWYQNDSHLLLTATERRQRSQELLPGNQVEISNDGISTNDSSSLSDEKSSSQPVTTGTGNSVDLYKIQHGNTDFQEGTVL